MRQNDENRIRSIRHNVEEKSVIIEKIVENIVQKYSQELDSEIDKIKSMLDDADNLEDSEIENVVMRLPVFMYYAINGLENLGVESDMAKAVKMELYNEKYISSEGTIHDKTHKAELETMNEQLVEVAFQRAYRKLREKVAKAEHVFSGAKKVISKRMIDAEITRQDKYN